MIIRVQHFVWGKLIGALNGLARSKAVSLTGVIQTQIVNFAFFLDSTGRCQIPGTGVSLYEVLSTHRFSKWPCLYCVLWTKYLFIILNFVIPPMCFSKNCVNFSAADLLFVITYSEAL